jgi:hypothetical protein
MRRFLKKCDIIVTKKNCGNSRPCVRCLDYLKKTGVRRIYYSYEQEFKMEKINCMESSHISSRYRKPWAEQNGEDKQKNEKCNT